MNSNRINAAHRAAMETEVRRAAGARAIAAMAVVGLLGMIAIGPGPSEDGALGLHTESYELHVPASLDDEYRREALAVAPATGVYEEPELTVHHEVHG
jgi:hypothetical protein